MPNERLITLRPIEPEAVIKKGDFTLNEIYNPDALDAADMLGETYYREVSPIPEGYEVCDLMCATKVLIGDGFRDVDALGNMQIFNYEDFHIRRLYGLGVLAIRPIPIPEPMRGETRAGQLIVSGRPDSAVLYLPKHLIGKTIRWEEVVKDGGK